MNVVESLERLHGVTGEELSLISEPRVLTLDDLEQIVRIARIVWRQGLEAGRIPLIDYLDETRSGVWRTRIANPNKTVFGIPLKNQ